jgi:membrane protease YdiL (CAAX protease family)
MRLGLCLVLFAWHWIVGPPAVLSGAPTLVVEAATEIAPAGAAAASIDRFLVAPGRPGDAWTQVACERRISTRPAWRTDPGDSPPQALVRCRFEFPRDQPFTSSEVTVETVQDLLAPHAIVLRPERGFALLPRAHASFTDPFHSFLRHGYALLLACLLALLSGWKWREDWRRAVEGMRSVAVIGLVWAPFFAAAAQAAVTNVLSTAPVPPMWVDAPLSHGLSYAFGAAVIAPFTEEWIYRGWILLGFVHRVRPPILIAVTALLFGEAHGPALDWKLQATVTGVLLALLWFRSRSLLLCMLAHALINLPNAVRAIIANA